MEEKIEILIAMRGLYLGVLARHRDGEIYLALFQSFAEVTNTPKLESKSK